MGFIWIFFFFHINIFKHTYKHKKILLLNIVYLTGLDFTSPSDFALVSSKEFLYIQATIECGFTLTRVRDMTRTYSHCLFSLSGSNEKANVQR